MARRRDKAQESRRAMEPAEARRAYKLRRREVLENWTEEEPLEEEPSWGADEDPDTAWPNEEGEQ